MITSEIQTEKYYDSALINYVNVNWFSGLSSQ